MAEITKIPSVLRTTQIRYWFWNLVSTPKPKSDGYPMRNRVLGSYRAGGKKKRRNIRRLTPSVPSTAAITNRRRRAMVLASSGSSCAEKSDANADARDGLGFCGGVVAPPGSTFELAIFPQSAR